VGLKALAQAVLQQVDVRTPAQNTRENGFATDAKTGCGIRTDFAADSEAARSVFQDTYPELAISSLAARVRAAWPWIGEHRPDFFRAISDADYSGDLERLRAAMEEASRAYEIRLRSEAVRIFSRVLGAELWIAASERAAEELHREGMTLPVLLPEEAQILAGMAQADARELLATLGKIQRAIPGARLRNVELVENG
jgi:hypothetical protein